MPDKESVQSMPAIDNYYNFNEVLKKWFERLMQHPASLIIAISRKAPRLIAVCRQKYPELWDDNKIVISEIAMPFIDFEQTYSDCILVDEAIYHGTTFEKNLQLVKALLDSHGQVCGLPIVVTQDALTAPIIVESLVEGWAHIDDDNCNFFIDTVISDFYALGIPYDIEYPLFYIKFDSEKSVGWLDSIICDVFRDFCLQNGLPFEDNFYKGKNFQRETANLYEFYTLLTDYLYDDRIDDLATPDFSKIRVFRNPSLICIASMSPYTINKEDICENSSLFGGNLRIVWNKMYKQCSKISSKDGNVAYQKNKSLVVLANYLLSFNHFLKIKSQLQSLFSEKLRQDIKLQVDLQDLELLFGYQEASSIKQLLELIEYSSSPLATSLVQGTIYQNLIPQKYQDTFMTQLMLDNMCDKDSVAAIMSNVFCNLHWTVEINSRQSPREKYDRLQFGLSMQSIQQICQDLYPIDSSSVNVNKALDARIDRGSVVPDYVYIEDAYDCYWRRLFRSGENEDVDRDQMLRICMNSLDMYFRKSKSQSIDYYELLLLLVLLSKYEEIFYKSKLAFNRLFANNIEVELYDNDYQILARPNGELEYDLLARLVDYHLIQKNQYDDWELIESPYAVKLLNHLPLADRDKKKMQRIVDFVDSMHRKVNGETTREILNYACFSNTEILDESITRFINMVIGYIEGHSNDAFSEIEEYFVDLYLAIPDVQLVVNDNLFASSEVGTWLRTKIHDEEIIEKVTQKCNKLFAAFYLLNVWVKSEQSELSQYYDKRMFDGINDNQSLFASDISACQAFRRLKETFGDSIKIKRKEDRNQLRDDLCLLLTKLN